jgi:hypothetical protein
VKKATSKILPNVRNFRLTGSSRATEEGATVTQSTVGGDQGRGVSGGGEPIEQREEEVSVTSCEGGHGHEGHGTGQAYNVS